jgi:hypothetical protein
VQLQMEDRGWLVGLQVKCGVACAIRRPSAYCTWTFTIAYLNTESIEAHEKESRFWKCLIHHAEEWDTLPPLWPGQFDSAIELPLRTSGRMRHND